MCLCVLNVTSMYMILKLRIDSQDLRRFVPETYPAVEPDALDNIVHVGVVIPLVAV